MFTASTVYRMIANRRIRLVNIVACLAISAFPVTALLITGCGDSGPVDGTVAALRAVASERSHPEKKRIDQEIKKRFVVTGKYAFSTVALTNGSVVVARDVKEQNDLYTMRVAQNEKGTIFSVRTFKKSEIASVETKSGEDAMWLRLKDSRLPATALDGYYHERMLALAFDHFLEEFPESQHTSNVLDLREVWKNEKATLERNWIKVKGEWYGPNEMSPGILFSMDSIETSIKNGRYFEAAQRCSKIRIPKGFNADKENLRAMRDHIQKRLEKYLQTQMTLADQKKSNAEKKYERQLAVIDSWKPGKLAFARNARAESSKEFERRKGLARSYKRGELRRKQLAARETASQEYDQTMTKINAQIDKIESKVLDAQNLLKTSS